MRKTLLIALVLFVCGKAYSQTVKDSIEAISNQIEEKYGITLFYNQEIPDSIFDTARVYIHAPIEDYPALLAYMKLFQTEFNKHPAKFIKTVNLKYIAIAKELTNTTKQPRYAVPDAKNEILYVKYPPVLYAEYYFKRVIHHEFYHMIEEEMNGSRFYYDPAWAKFNASDFSYGAGGNEFYSKGNSSAINHPINGFISTYSTSALEEDKAEIFATLFIEDERKELEEWIKEDEILAAKWAYLKNFLYQTCNDWGDFLFEQR